MEEKVTGLQSETSNEANDTNAKVLSKKEPSASTATKKAVPIKAIIAVICAISIIAVVVAVFANGMTEEEKHAVLYTKDLISIMKDPGSFTLVEDIIHSKMAEVDGGHDCYYITYTASNSYGAQIKSTCCYCDGERYDDIGESKSINRYDYNSTDEYKNALLSDIMRHKLSQNYILCKAFSNSDQVNDKSTSIISAKKIAKKAHCNYADYS